MDPNNNNPSNPNSDSTPLSPVADPNIPVNPTPAVTQDSLTGQASAWSTGSSPLGESAPNPVMSDPQQAAPASQPMDTPSFAGWGDQPAAPAAPLQANPFQSEQNPGPAVSPIGPAPDPTAPAPVPTSPEPIPTFTPPSSEGGVLGGEPVVMPPAVPGEVNNNPSTPESPMPTEPVPTDLSHLVETGGAAPIIGTAIPQPESLVVPPAAPGQAPNPEASQVVVGSKGPGLPKWLFLVGGVIILLVAAASAYFILGVGGNKTALPFGLFSQPQKPPVVESRVTTPPRNLVPESNNSPSALTPTSLGTLPGTSPSAVTPTPLVTQAATSSSSALQLLRLRQQAQ